MGRKSDTAFACCRCGHETIVYAAQCTFCKSFNSYVSLYAKDAKRVTMEALVRDNGEDDEDTIGDDASEYVRPIRACDIEDDDVGRVTFGIDALDAVLGNEHEVTGAPLKDGVALGACILFGGDPGTGKTTLAIQAALRMADAGAKTMIASGEMTPRRSKALAKRVGPWTAKSAKRFHILEGQDADAVFFAARKMLPAVLVFDSLQYFKSEAVVGVAGSISQVEYISKALSDLAHEIDCIVFAICHVNKDGQFAGPKTAEHAVDAAMDIKKTETYEVNGRVKLSTTKNRFGSSRLTGMMRMTGKGLQPVSDEELSKSA